MNYQKNKLNTLLLMFICPEFTEHTLPLGGGEVLRAVLAEVARQDAEGDDYQMSADNEMWNIQMAAMRLKAGGAT